jgi:FHA domain
VNDETIDADDPDDPGGRTMILDPNTLPGLIENDQVHILVLQDAGGPLLRIEVGTTPKVLGRSDAADITLADPRVSTRHCQILLVGENVQVTDLNSTNGTLVDQRRVQGTTDLPVGARLRVGRFVFLHELRTRSDMRKARELESDLQKACAYVRALLPLPLTQGPIQTDWCYVPCSILGGDAFGYHELDPDRLAFYLLDVCGHGAPSPSGRPRRSTCARPLIPPASSLFSRTKASPSTR